MTALLDAPTVATRPPTARDMQAAISLVESTGLYCEQRGACVYAWYVTTSPDGGPYSSGFRFVDVAGLLASDDPTAYALGCLDLGGAR